MNKEEWLKLDFLRRRRQVAGIKSSNQKFGNRLRNIGILIGLGIISIPIGISLLMINSINNYNRESYLIKAQVERYEKVATIIRKSVIKLEENNTFNKLLAETIVGLRSGSAILSEIRNLIPITIQLTNLNVINDGIELLGEVQEPLGLGSINNLMLQLEDSPFFGYNHVKLVEVKEKRITVNKNSSNELSHLSFKIVASFDPDKSKINSNKLVNLGSRGLSKRIDILKAEGLI